MTDRNAFSRRDILLPAMASTAAMLLPSGTASAASQDTDTPPFEGIMQISFIVEDLQQAMEQYTQRLGIGPWFVSPHFSPEKNLYRGEPNDADVSIGMTFSGPMNFELIQMHDEKPSVYRETFLRRSYGFHHWAMASHDIEADIAKYQASGHEIALDIIINGGRVVYADTSTYLDGMTELIEITEGVRSGFGNMFRIARDWDGKDLIFAG